MLSRGKVQEAEPIAVEQTSQDDQDLEVSQKHGHTLTNGKASLRGGIEDVVTGMRTARCVPVTRSVSSHSGPN